MRYRLWKKKYKKMYGDNPSAVHDFRKRRKLAKKIARMYGETRKFVGKQIASCIIRAAKTIGNLFKVR